VLVFELGGGIMAAYWDYGGGCAYNYFLVLAIVCPPLH
jgi:hypothetical protein